MIVIDFSGMVYMNCHTTLKNPADLTMENVRHYVLEDIRRYNKKYRGKYGQLIICMDNTHNGNWRKHYFPEYKAKRKEGRDKSVFNWTLFFEYFEQIKNELKEFFPYIIIDQPGTEADDAIGWLAETKMINEPMMIISADKDFKQLQKYADVKQYSYIVRKQIDESYPLRYIKEHTIRGDAADGIPNVMSDDNVFITPGKKQKSIMTKDMDRWLKLPLSIVKEELAMKLVIKPTEKNLNNEFTFEQALEKIEANWKRNTRMVDLEYVPDFFKNKFQEQFDTPPKGKSNRLYSYFIKKNLPIMINFIDDFL